MSADEKLPEPVDDPVDGVVEPVDDPDAELGRTALDAARAASRRAPLRPARVLAALKAASV